MLALLACSSYPTEINRSLHPAPACDFTEVLSCLTVPLGKATLNTGLHGVNQVIDLANALEGRLQRVRFPKVGLYRLKSVEVLELRSIANEASHPLTRAQRAEQLAADKPGGAGEQESGTFGSDENSIPVAGAPKTDSPRWAGG